MGNKKILWVIFFSILLYLAAILYIGLDKVFLTLSNFNLYYIPIIFFFLIIGLLFGFLRWAYYLKILNIKIRFKQSFLIFFAGLSAGFMPSKSGELLRNYLLKKFNKTPISKSLPIHFVSNILIFLFAVMLSLPLVISFDLSRSLIIILILLIAFIILMKNSRTTSIVLRFCGKIPIIKNHMKNFTNFYCSSDKLITPRTLITSFILTFFASIFSYSVFYFVLRALGVKIHIIYALSIYAFSLIVGALSMLPGGVGATEGTIFALLLLFGVSSSIAAVATLLIRVFNLYFITLLGLVFFGVLNKSTLEGEKFKHTIYKK